MCGIMLCAIQSYQAQSCCSAGRLLVCGAIATRRQRAAIVPQEEGPVTTWRVEGRRVGREGQQHRARRCVAALSHTPPSFRNIGPQLF